MAHLGNTVVNGALRVLGGEYVDTINGVTVGSSPKFTDTNTTYTFATGDSNGQIKVTPSGGSAQNVSVKGLGTAAYTASTAYATSNHTHATSIATSSGTNQLTLAASTKYAITAGGTSYIFTTPPDNDTKNTAGSTNTSSKIFLIGATSQAANPQTYSDDQVYATSGTLTTNKLSSKALVALTGTGTAGSDKGSGVSPRYIPSLWTFNSGVTVANGEVYLIKIPVAGGTYGVWLSLNNGTNYYPVAVSNSTGRFTTHYAANTVIAVTYESAGKCSCYARTGGDALETATGIFRVLNDYDSNTTYSAMSSSELTTGTATTSRVVRADYLKTGIDSLIDTKIQALDVTTSGAGASKTLTALSETDGKISATFGNISITKSQVSDFPTSMTPTSHTHGNITNGGALQTNDITIASGDKLVVTDSSDSAKVARTSISFDASTATQCLTKKGTWATFVPNTGGTFNAANGTAGAEGATTITIGNATGAATANNSYGRIRLYRSAGTSATTAYYTEIRPGANTANRTITFPDATGTVALTSNIPGVVSTTANGLAPKVTDTSKFLKGDGTWATPTNTTYSSKAAASGGTDVSLCTTGEKYTWNNKSNLAIGTTSTTAAAGNHTHTLSIATDSGTNQLTLAASTKYKITAGGSSYIFTTPPNTTYSAMSTSELTTGTATTSRVVRADYLKSGINSLITAALPTWSGSVSAAANATSCTISNSNITTSSNIEPFSSNSDGYTVNITRMVVSAGKVVLYFNALSQATSFKVRIS